MTNFMILDIAGAMRGVAGLAAILLAPGYVAGWIFDLFGFRGRTLLERMAWSIALSFAAAPIAIQLLGHFVPLPGVAVLFGLAGLAMAGLLIVDRRHLQIPLNRHTVLLGLFVAFGAAVVLFELVDLQRGNRLYLSVTVADQGFRVGFIDAIAHTGIPPQNPLYHPGASAPLRYYYFWYAVCAVCMKLVGVTARQALIASSVWSGLGLLALIALYAKHFLKVREGLHRFILTAALLLAVTGLDILPVLFNLFVDHDFSGDLEWWSTDQISSWMDSILWVPNHTAALLCCLTAFLLLWRTRDGLRRRHAAAASVLAGVAAASAFGLSIYVAAAFAMVIVGWAVSLWFRERDRGLVRRLGVAVLTAGLLLIPYLRELTGSHSGTEGNASTGPAHMFQLSVRTMIHPDLITALPMFAVLNKAHPVLFDQAARLVLLLPGYALELGAFGFVMVLALAGYKRLDRAHGTALALALGGLVLMSFLRSAVIGNNDFGYRAALLPSFFLLLLTAERLARPQANGRVQAQILGVLIFLGAAGTAFQALMLRVYVPLHVAARMPGFAGLPEEAYAARSAYARAAALIASTAIVQANPVDPRDYASMTNLLYAQRAMVTDAEVDCGAVFGGDPASCDEIQDRIAQLFLSPAPSAGEARARCREFGADYLAVARSDPAWNDARGWVWMLPVVGADTESGAGGGVRPAGDTMEKSAAAFRVVDCKSPEKLTP